MSVRRFATLQWRLLACLAFAPLAGCSDEPAAIPSQPDRNAATAVSPVHPASGGDILPTGHPAMEKTLPHPASGKNQLKVVTPAAVSARWKAVELGVQIAGSAEQKLVIRVGGEGKVFRSDLAVKVLAYLPAFKIQDGTATSSSNDADNPAALVQVQGSDGNVTEGWIYQKFPQFDTFHSDRIQLKLLTASASAR